MRELSERELADLILEEIRTCTSLIICIGTRFRSDDAAALKLCSILRDLTEEEKIILCEEGLENCLDRIMRKKPERLLILDSAALGVENAGRVFLMDLEDLDEKIVWSHRIPISMVLRILKASAPLKKITIIGIGGERFYIGEELSPPVKRFISSMNLILREYTEI
ncbi:MAG: hydrogenase maturation protease [Sulfolobales archaeon]